MAAVRTGIDRTALVSLCGLAVALPFELKTPIFGIGPIVVSNVEGVLYATIAIAAVRRLLGGPWPSASILHWAVLVWVGVVVCSALAAPAEREAALKFALRSAGGCLLFLAAADTVRTLERAALLGGALAVGAAVSATAGIVEVWLPALRDALMPFRAQHAFVGGFARASGTFDYANTAAMYWEGVLPVTIAVGACLTLTGGRWALRAVVVAMSMIVAIAIALSLSRAGLLVGAAGVLALIMVARGARLAPLGWHAAAALAGLVLLVLVTPSTAGVVALRLRSNDVAEWYRPEFRVAPDSATLEAGTAGVFAVTVRNDGLLAWPTDGEGAIALSHRWQAAEASVAAAIRGAPVALPEAVRPGDQVTVEAVVRAPDLPGSYRLQWDIVVGHVTWFATLDGPATEVPVVVTPGSVQARPRPFDPGAFVPPEPRLRRPELWAAAWQMWKDRPILGVGPDNFRHLYGAYTGRAGADARVHANSLYVETLATLGVAGLLALGGLMAALAWQIRREWLRVPTPASRTIVAGLAVGLGAFMVHGLVDYFLIFTPTYGLFWLLTGSVAGLASRSDPS